MPAALVSPSHHALQTRWAALQLHCPETDGCFAENNSQEQSSVAQQQLGITSSQEGLDITAERETDSLSSNTYRT